MQQLQDVLSWLDIIASRIKNATLLNEELTRNSLYGEAI